MFFFKILKSLTLSSLITIVMFLVYFATAALITDIFRLNYSRNYNSNIILNVVFVTTLITYILLFAYFLK